MSNQRKASKVHLGAYVERSLRERIVRIAKARGMTVTDLLVEILQAELARYYGRYPQHDEKVLSIAADALNFPHSAKTPEAAPGALSDQRPAGEGLPEPGSATD